MKSALAVIVVGGLLGALGAHAADSGSGYHLLGRIPIPGDGGYYDFLFVDEASRRVYVSWGTQVAVVDADKGAVVGTVDGFKKVHGIVMTPAGGFITDGGTSSVAKFDPKTLKVTGTVPAGNNPDAIMYDSASKRVLAFNHSGKNVTVIDPAAAKAVATIELGGTPEVGRADGKGTVWVNLEDTSEVVRIDTKKMAVTARWKLAPCEEPTGLAYDAKDGRLFAGCANKMMAVLDASSGKVVTTVPIGPGVDGTDFDPGTGLVFNSCGGEDGTLAVVKRTGPDKYVALQAVPTQPRAKTLAVDGKTHKVFLSAARFEAPPPGQKRGKMVPGSFSVLVYGR